MKVIVDLNRWYAFGVAKDHQCSNSRLLREDNRQCCLGFCALAHGVKRADILQRAYPRESFLSKSDWMLTQLGDEAAMVNDGATSRGWYDDRGFDWAALSLEERMGFLITIFAEGGDELEFTV